jgi:hypothetical protein
MILGLPIGNCGCLVKEAINRFQKISDTRNSGEGEISREQNAVKERNNPLSRKISCSLAVLYVLRCVEHGVIRQVLQKMSKHNLKTNNASTFSTKRSQRLLRTSIVH